MPSCAACGQLNPEHARFCLACGARLGAGPTDARRTVTVLFADLVDSTTLAERVDAESFRSLLMRYYGVSRAAIERHGGAVEKYAGDAVMAVFGFPTAHEDDALRALRAAVEIRASVAALPGEIGADVHIGLNTGEVVVGTGDAGVAATGDAVNVAARLEQAAAAGEILLGGATHRLVRDAAEAEPLAPLAVKGRSELVEAFRFLEFSRDADRGRLASQLVGREDELDVLARAFQDAVRERRAKLLTIVGAPGVGKSRLARELAVRIGDDAAVLRGRCLPYGDGITFWPVKELVSQAAGLTGGEPSEAAQAKLESLLDPGTERAPVAARVAEIVGVVEGGEVGLAEQFWAVRVLLEALSRRRPLIVVFDDLQWAEPTMVDLVGHLVRAHDAPILALCLARPELLDAPPNWLDADAVVQLGPLTDGQTATLVSNLASGAPYELCERLAEVSEGNPLFAEELVRVLVDDGALVQRHDGWRLVRDVADVRVPPTIHALLASRLDLLAGVERRVLGIASVEGRRFHQGAVERLAVADAPQVEATLGELVAKQLVRPDEPEFDGEHAFRFHHLLVRDVAYESVRKEERADLHERFVDWLDDKTAERTSEYDEIAGHHLELSHRYRAELGRASPAVAARAATRIVPAGLRAHARGDMPAAAALLSRAAELMPAEAPQRAILQPKLDEALLEQRLTTPNRLDRGSLRCFWSWPFGHAWRAAERRGLRVLRCDRCGKERRRTKTDRPYDDAEAKMLQTGGGFWGGGGD